MLTFKENLLFYMGHPAIIIIIIIIIISRPSRDEIVLKQLALPCLKKTLANGIKWLLLKAKWDSCIFNIYLLGGNGYDLLALLVGGSWYFITELEGVRCFFY